MGKQLEVNCEEETELAELELFKLIGFTDDTGALAASWRCHCQRANICILLFNIISFVLGGESLRPRFEEVYKYCTSHLHPWVICA